jgi:subtilisin family serine protease
MPCSTTVSLRRRGAALTATVVLTTGLAATLGTAGPAAAITPDDASASGYVVVLRTPRAVPGTSPTRLPEHAAATRARGRGATVVAAYHYALSGFAARLDAVQLAAVRRDPDVAEVVPDGTVSASASTQPGATWGLDRIDQRTRPLDGSYTYDATGTGVTAYVIDTGIRATHTDLGGRVAAGYTAVADGQGTADCNGHGTHVAGTLGGTQYGVAKQVTLVPVRVLGCTGSGSISGVISGVDWVTGQPARPAVANMSLGGSANAALDAAVANSVAAGVTYAVAAGNSSANACRFSPARVPTALTVGATTSSDGRASYSNYGSCLDLFAPGSAITSDWYTGDSATNTLSGTSMASPHAAGVAALYLQEHPGAAPSEVTAAITAQATPAVVTSAGRGSPNRLLYSRLT